MSKFQKRISKTGRSLENCLLVGQGFGFLEDCLEIFSTVFVLDDQKPKIRVKNLVYIDEESIFSQLSGITHILFDLRHIKDLEKIQGLWLKHKSIVIIEGNDPIGREFSKPLYNTHWQCTDTQGFFHIWEQKK